ncbi:hypothetical protein [Oceaniglobus ichthyenteri]|nr:hypothetical protein [Oceaniglobus ichthyenteri]
MSLNLILEGWPIYGAIALVGVITYGALRPYIKGKQPARKKDTKT